MTYPPKAILSGTWADGRNDRSGQTQAQGGGAQPEVAGYVALMSDPIARLNAALEGRYRIERELGEGGMATVYLAKDLKHSRNVALKVLKPELAAVVGAERFLAEIETTANLQHPHILPLFDSGVAGSFLFYVMPYVEGESLRERLDREHQLSVDDAVRMATNVAEALDYAHRHGVIHRDIKPANILLQDGKSVVSDFGIALAVTAGGAGRLTETGLSLGTPHYMSPEQATGDLRVGAATDLYALGCVLYEMLVGEPPYTGSTPQAILGKIIAGKLASAKEHRSSVPPNVDGAIRKALEKVPADRFMGVADFARALGEAGFRHGEETAAVGAKGVGLWNRLSVAMTGLSVALAVGLALSLGAPQPPTPLALFAVAVPQGEAYAFNLCCGTNLALSPDDEWLAFITQEGRLYRRRVGQLAAEPVPGGENARAPFFSPDSRWLGFWSGGRLLRAPMTGGPPVPIAETNNPRGATWGDNDMVVFDGPGGELQAVPSTGGVPAPVPGAVGERYSNPWMLPGGEAALMITRAAPVERRVVVMDLETGEVDTLAIGTLARYASGHILFSTADGTLLAQPFDPAARRTTGPSVPILDGLFHSGTALGAQFSSSESGLVYSTGSIPPQPLIIQGGGAPGEVPLREGGDLEEVAFSPDGRRIAMRIDNLGDSQDIWIFDRDQNTQSRLTVEGYRNMIPVWTPDGARVAFMSHREGFQQGQIYWQPVDGTGPAERLVGTEYQEFPGSWSPDGKTLAFAATRGGGRDVGLFTLGDSEPRWVLESEFSEVQPQISPDGRWLAYTSNRSGEPQVYVEAMDGERRRVQVSMDEGHSPRWDPTGTVLYYAEAVDGTSGTIVGATVETDGALRVTSRQFLFSTPDLNNTTAPNFDVGPNGEEFVYVGSDDAEGIDLVWILNWPEIVREMTTVR